MKIRHSVRFCLKDDFVDLAAVLRLLWDTTSGEAMRVRDLVNG